MTKRFVYVIAGLTQTKATENGMRNLFEKMCAWRSPDTAVSFMRWCDNAQAEAEDVVHLVRKVREVEKDENFQPIILIFSYSYGGGYATPRLVSEFRKRGLVVTVVVISDGVWRLNLGIGRFGRYIEMLFSPIAITLIGKIRFQSGSVSEIFWFYQRQREINDICSWPLGREPICLGAVIHKGVELNVPHQSMDDEPAFHARCIKEAFLKLGEPPSLR